MALTPEFLERKKLWSTGKESENGSPGMRDMDLGESFRCLLEGTKHERPIRALCLLSDGGNVACGTHEEAIHEWNRRSASPPKPLGADETTGRRFSDPFGGEAAAGVLSVAVTADGKRVVGGTDESSIKIWHADNGRLLCTLGGTNGHSGPVNAVAVTPDGKHIVSGSEDMTIKIWDEESGLLPRTLDMTNGHTQAVLSVAISADGTRIVSGSEDSTIKIWDVESGYLVRTLGGVEGFADGHSDVVRAVAITADGTRIVSGSEDKTVKVWDTESGRLVRTLGLGSSMDGHTSGVLAVAATPDGRRIVSGSGDRSVKIWDGHSGLLLRTLSGAYGHSDEVTAVAVTSDGTRVVSGSADCTIKLWDANSTFGGCSNPAWTPTYALSLLKWDLKAEPGKATQRADLVVNYAASLFKHAQRQRVRSQAREIVVDHLPAVLPLEDAHVGAVIRNVVVRDMVNSVLDAHRIFAAVALDGVAILFLWVGHARSAWIAMTAPDDVDPQGPLLALWPVLLLCAAAAYGAVREALQVYLYAKRGVFLRGYLCDVWNANNLASLLSAGALAYLLLSKSASACPKGTQLVAALGVLPPWIKVLGYLKPLSVELSTFVVSLVRIVKDLFSLSVVFFLLMAAVASSFYLLLGPDSVGAGVAGDFDAVEDSLWSVLRLTVCDFFNRMTFAGGVGDAPDAAVVLMAMYLFGVTVLLMNMFIAVVSNSFERSMEAARAECLRSRVRLFVGLHALIGLESVGGKDLDAWLSAAFLPSANVSVATLLAPVALPVTALLDLLAFSLRSFLDAFKDDAEGGAGGAPPGEDVGEALRCLAERVKELEAKVAG